MSRSRDAVGRVTPRCPFFGPCGGCDSQDIPYAEQLRAKQKQLERLLKQSLGASVPEVRAPLTAGEWGFRNKVHFVVTPTAQGSRSATGLALGHYRRGSQSVVAVDQCPVHAEEGNRVAFALRDALADAGIDAAAPDLRRGIARHIVVRVTEPARAGRGAGGSAVQTMLTLVVTRNDRRLKTALTKLVGGHPSTPVGGPPLHAPTALALNINDRTGPYLFGEETRHLHGPRRVRETVAGTSFLISPTSFFQTNVRAAERMVTFVLEQVSAACADSRRAEKPPAVLDLFAGAGLFALPLAARGARVVAVEENRDAIEDGEASRRLNRIAESACRFVCARAEDVASGARRLRTKESPDLVVLDPPRAGCPPRVLRWICGTVRPRRIIYVSCNPLALAEDLRVPIAAGYGLEVVQPVDMFPHTAHIETVAVLVLGS